MRVKVYALRDGFDTVAGTLTPDGEGDWTISAASKEDGDMLNRMADDYDPTEDDMRQMQHDFRSYALRCEVEGGGAPHGEKTFGPHKWATTQLNLPRDVAAQVSEIAERIPAYLLDPKGREDDVHVTVLYGLQTDDAEVAAAAVAGASQPSFAWGTPHVFAGVEEGTCDAVVVRVAPSAELLVLRERLLRLPHKDQYPEYLPHVTLAYVQLGRGGEVAELVRPMVERLASPVTVPALTFSDRMHRKTEIDLDPWRTISYVRPIRPSVDPGP